MRGHPSVLLLYLGLTTCLDTSPSGKHDQGPEVFLDSPEAQSFLGSRSRIPRANHWDLELLTPGNLERECWEERFWENYIYNGKGGHGRVDVAGLAVGLTSGILLIVLTGLGAFWYLHCRLQGRGQQPSPQDPWPTGGTRYLLPGCLCSARFMCDYHPVDTVSGEAAACGLWVFVGVCGMYFRVDKV
ncbi:transmembrane gamma-carboxyglutamic acid protein 2 isoform X1 [Phacochoerus africanus]|uniref:transmembrane gamma-carboxyglutamic acid protein 2 isoform X1 n=1 Tax=Phacochoerus africanus TaxID=41426 RepID=UPI001FD90FF2|nr:transmembrane gamma-carboxyglutamic acid protein 2 isoform X1 [Phacochoerus africanus]XP_047646152.1 transmembrane gamma-carboxyglutamic acid protein 2 isoform X1 [Phacochoerus africanus]XP_047646153.1 transmembrane gamma-carboxyglutamic acid protein 2 isoform X1 [Phacochoerus africanus]